MKTENTLENRAKFFALYWGQSVVQWNTDIRPNDPMIMDRVVFNTLSYGYYLQLKPLESISDEDAKHLGFPDNISATTTYIKSIGVELKDSDWLRSKGYAMPWMDLSVQDLINYGWIKLAE